MKKTVFILAILFMASFSMARPTTQIELDKKNTEPTPLQTSEKADIWLELKNKGTTTAENVELEFLENYPYSVERGDKTKWSFGKVVPGDEYQIHLKVKVDENAVPGNNSLEFRSSTGDISIVKKVPVEVRSDRNVLAIKDIEFPDKAAPGTTKQMSLRLENLADSQLKNIEVKADVSSEDLPFATSESSTKNIASIEPGGDTWANFSMAIDESAENAVYKLPIDLGFENEAGTEFEQSTTTGVNIGGKPLLQPGLNTESYLEPGTSTDITLRLVNRGHGSAEFVSLELEENDNIEVVGTNEVYIGSMDSDDFQTASYKIYIDEGAENLEMPVKLSYTESSGNKTVVKTVDAEVYTQDQLKQYGLNSGGNIVPVVVVLVILAGAGIYYWRRKRKKE